MLLASLTDVLDRLIDDEDVDEDRAAALLEEASALVEAYLGHVPNPVPDPVRLVTARMVARVLEAPEQSFAATSTQYTAGPFQQQVSYSQGASGGAPWLTASDKTMLAPFRRRRLRGVYSMTMS
ncbi:hypothetical protein [Corynebacterium lizhenjunii]|uniref:hypothetical protein n=1 Tax=Corynebacterium lizhenjunii TaxID=2709394 RepID=UPI0013EA52C9|nr:hypothetical protein [Corynebacterium lizhenjunii]